ncbi:hypothetical protein [Candidatus Zinderia endosymbiont of Aphrophora alni]|uniref:hypothetical protein n=1 Tax=Candidatus Zinderia endosymbiont of Aphrophora alni TaxID=3077951 RepID=UPI0030CD726D
MKKKIIVLLLALLATMNFQKHTMINNKLHNIIKKVNPTFTVIEKKINTYIKNKNIPKT